MKKRMIGFMAVCLAFLSGCASDAADNHAQGMELYEQGKYDQAVQYLTRAVAENNAKGTYYIDLGMNYLELKDYVSAKDAFDHAVSLGDDLEQAYRGLGIMCMDQGLYADAVAYFDQAIDQVEIKVGKLEYDILQYRAEAEVNAGNYQQALDAYDALIQLGVEVSDNRMAKGNVYLLMGNETEAVSCFDQVLAEKNQDVSIYFRVYNAFQKVGMPESGVAYLNKALEVAGDTDADHLNRGKIYYLMGNYTSSIAELSYPLANDDPEAALYTALCYEAQGDYETAIEIYMNALNKNNDPVMSNYLAMCLSANGEDNRAWNLVHTTMENFPDCECLQDLKWNEIILYERMEMFPSAYTRLLEYQKAYPDDPNIEEELQFLLLKQS